MTRRFLVILVLSIVCRLALGSASYMPDIEADYRRLGQDILTGQTYHIDNEYYLPGYAYLLAVFGKGLRTLQMLADALLGPALLFAVSGSLAAFLYAIAIPIAHAAGYPLPDALTVLICLAAVTPFVLGRTWKAAALSGLLLGLASWLRGDFLALLLLLTILGRHRLVFIAAWLAPTLALGLFWYAHYGVFSLTRPGLGLLLWEGIGQGANPWQIQPLDTSADELLSAQGLRYATAQSDSFLLREYAVHLANRPDVILPQIATRLVRLMTVSGDASIGRSSGLLLAFAGLSGLALAHSRRYWLALWLSRVIPFAFMRDEVRFALPLLVVYFVGIGWLVASLSKGQKENGSTTVSTAR